MFVMLTMTFLLIIKNRSLKKQFAAKVKIEVERQIRKERGDNSEPELLTIGDPCVYLTVANSNQARLENPQSAPIDLALKVAQRE